MIIKENKILTKYTNFQPYLLSQTRKQGLFLQLLIFYSLNTVIS